MPAAITNAVYDAVGIRIMEWALAQDFEKTGVCPLEPRMAHAIH